MNRVSVMLSAPRHLQFVSEALSEPAPDEVLVRTIAGAISVGSELPQYRGDGRYTVPLSYPRMTGYENVAEILKTGHTVHHVSPGERVLGFYGHRTHELLKGERIIKIPAGADVRVALLAILSCDAAKGIRRLHPYPEEAVLITGAGVMGLLALFVLQAYGVRCVDIIEPRTERQVIAKALGARHIFTPNESDAIPNGYTIGIECSSRDAAFALLQKKLIHNGRICVLSDGNIEPLSLLPDFHAKELTIAGSSDGWDYRTHADWYFRVAPQYPLERLFDQAVQWDELPDTFARIMENPPLKVLVEYPEETCETNQVCSV